MVFSVTVYNIQIQYDPNLEHQFHVFYRPNMDATDNSALLLTTYKSTKCGYCF